MAETPRDEGTIQGAGAELLGAARERGMQRLEGAKGQLAEGAERVASAVERTADELDEQGEGTISGFGHSVATLMRQLAGGIRERDVDEFARELGTLARRNPGVFLAGSVALGFGIARFFKARSPESSMGQDYGRQYGRSWQDTSARQDSGWQDSGWQDSSNWQGSREQRSGDSTRGMRREFDEDESLDLSASSPGVAGSSGLSGSSSFSGSSPGSATTPPSPDDDRLHSKASQTGKQKAKPQRASSGGSQRTDGAGSPGSSGERPATETSSPGESSGSGSAFTGGTGGGSLRGGKS